MTENNPYGITFENVWGPKDDLLREQICKVWLDNEMITSQEAAMERSRQVVFVVRNENAEIIGISTAYPEYIEQLKNNLFVFRCMLVPGNRYPGLLTKLTVITRDFLESIHKEYDPLCIGILTDIQNPKLLEHRREAVYPGSGFTFIGQTKTGSQLRIFYFKGAKI